jgi:isopentenyl-diphosphate Delta-isomerase
VALTTDREQVVLLAESGQAVGVADKATVHTEDTPLHLAFSCYVFNGAGEFLLTQRAHGKKTWPGVWTNTCCGHPAPGEDLAGAVRRRLRDELGLTVGPIRLVLPGFRYRAVMDNGFVENEMCPVFVAETADQPAPNPAEVDGTEWVPWTAFAASVRSGERAISPWCRLQVEQLAPLGEPASWPAGDPAALPAAARVQSTVE